MAANKQIMTHFTGKLTVVATPTAKKGMNQRILTSYAAQKISWENLCFLHNKGNKCKLGSGCSDFTNFSKKCSRTNQVKTRHFNIFTN